jgi:hypothetical protein
MGEGAGDGEMIGKMLLAALLAAAPAAAQSPAWRLTPEGYGPARIGMTRDQVAAALSIRLEGEAIEDADVCVEMGAASGYPDLYFMFENGRLSRISAGERSRVTTPRGIGIGATAAQVRRAYGPALRAETHTYIGRPGEYLTFWTRRNQRGVRFETGADRRVTTIHAGNATIQYIEGCA